MLNPVELTSGVIYDARLIIVNAAAIFGGPITAIITALVASLYRMWIGGIGASSGAMTIAIALIIGLIFYYAIQKKWLQSNASTYLLTAFITHVIILIAIQFTLDTSQFQNAEFIISELVLLPFATVLVCLLMQSQEKKVIAQHEADKALSRLNAISQSIPDLLIVLDKNGKYLEVFSANQDLLVMPREAVIGKTLHDVFSKDQADFFLTWIRSVIADKDTKTIEYEVNTPSGKLDFEARARYLDNPENGQESVVLLTRDISNRRILETQIHSLAYFDPLTNLPNRRHLMEHLEVIEKFNIEGKNFGALFHIDLDDFKYINEVHGHATGDQILRDVVLRLQEIVQAKHYLARIGGDAFAIFIEDLHRDCNQAKELANHFAHQILGRIREPFTRDENQIPLSGSVGIVMLGGSYPLHQLMVWAELALYAAKDEGKDTSKFFDPILQESLTQRMKLESEIRVALITNQFKLFYQPQVDTRSQIIGYEALIRWNHPEKGTLSPVEFLPVAEQAGIMSSIDRWVFQKACKDLNQLIQKSGNPNLTLSINIGGAFLGQPDLYEQLSNLAHDQGVDPHRIQIEVTETTLVKNLERSKAQMFALKGLGFKFSLDDFGTGYSSFNYLRQFPIDEVKIDQSFVHDLPEDHESLAIIKSVVALAPTFGFTVIAEGIESMEQEKSLIDNGCTHFQGYFYSKPLPLEYILDQSR